MREIDSLFEKAIRERVFPSASLIIFEKDSILYEQYYGTYNYDSEKRVSGTSLYDVASLTKPLITSLGIAILVQNREIRFGQEMGYFFNEFKGSDKLNITLRDMLNHRAGLPPHREYFQSVPEERWGTAIARDTIIKMALNEAIVEYGRSVYSDIDFIILGYLIEVITGMSLRDFIHSEFLQPIGVRDADFCGRQEYMKSDLMLPVTNGLIGVDDENCRAMGGIAGHAGLFSNVREIYLILQEILDSYLDADWRVLRPDVLKDLLMRSNDFEPSMFRGGFDTPDKINSQYGDNFSSETIGHLGFTGTSFVVDLSSGFGVVILTNRVCPHRENIKIRDFRRSIHNEIFTRFMGGRVL